ncbi:MAG: ATP-binding cassette domain-containing protein [Spirochaetales bacterium]|nr:ATP-binding cassette domain-containing protein [Spirochaetales bacterium]
MILLDGVSLSYGNRQVLDCASMQMDDGSITALLGASGAGKSTVAKILTGIVRPQCGKVDIDGRTLVSPNKAYDRKLGLCIQMVHQHPHLALDPRQRIYDGMLEIVRYHHMENRIIDVAMSVGLEPATLRHLPMQISGGEAQRVSLAKALLFSPRLLILDEATSMLDVSTQANVLALAKRAGGSILLITHDRELAESYAGQIFMIEDRKIRGER